MRSRIALIAASTATLLALVAGCGENRRNEQPLPIGYLVTNGLAGYTFSVQIDRRGKISVEEESLDRGNGTGAPEPIRRTRTRTLARATLEEIETLFEECRIDDSERVENDDVLDASTETLTAWGNTLTYYATDFPDGCEVAADELKRLGEEALDRQA